MIHSASIKKLRQQKAALKLAGKGALGLGAVKEGGMVQNEEVLLTPHQRENGGVATSYDSHHSAFAPMYGYLNPADTGSGKWEDRAAVGIYVGNDPSNPNVVYMRVTHNKPVKWLVSKEGYDTMEGRAFRKKVRCRHYYVDDSFYFDVNNSPSAVVFDHIRNHPKGGPQKTILETVQLQTERYMESGKQYGLKPFTPGFWGLEEIHLRLHGGQKIEIGETIETDTTDKTDANATYNNGTVPHTVAIQRYIQK